MKTIRTIFLGSTSDSVLALEKLNASRFPLLALKIVAVVTQLPSPTGRRMVLKPTPVDIWAKEHNITVLAFPQNQKPWLYENESTVIDTLQPLKADLLVSACYGQKIPIAIIRSAKYGGLNVHPSILPRWRGADPVPWAILSGDQQTGVTVVTLAEKFDEGKIIAQIKLPIPTNALPDPLRSQLFTLGAELLVQTLSAFEGQAFKGVSQGQAHATYARRLTRQDGYIPWEFLEYATRGIDLPASERPLFFQKIVIGHWPIVIERATRALSPWPGVWTTVQCQITNDKCIMLQGKRMKIISAHTTDNLSQAQHLVLDTVQLEGKKPVQFRQFSNAYLH